MVGFFIPYQRSLGLNSEYVFENKMVALCDHWADLGGRRIIGNWRINTPERGWGAFLLDGHGRTRPI